MFRTVARRYYSEATALAKELGRTPGGGGSRGGDTGTRRSLEAGVVKIWAADALKQGAKVDRVARKLCDVASVHISDVALSNLSAPGARYLATLEPNVSQRIRALSVVGAADEVIETWRCALWSDNCHTNRRALKRLMMVASGLPDWDGDDLLSVVGGIGGVLESGRGAHVDRKMTLGSLNSFIGTLAFPGDTSVLLSVLRVVFGCSLNHQVVERVIGGHGSGASGAHASTISNVSQLGRLSRSSCPSNLIIGSVRDALGVLSAFDDGVRAMVMTPHSNRGRPGVYGNGMAFWELLDVCCERLGIVKPPVGVPASKALKGLVTADLEDVVNRACSVLLGVTGCVGVALAQDPAALQGSIGRDPVFAKCLLSNALNAITRVAFQTRRRVESHHRRGAPCVVPYTLGGVIFDALVAYATEVEAALAKFSETVTSVFQENVGPGLDRAVGRGQGGASSARSAGSAGGLHGAMADAEGSGDGGAQEAKAVAVSRTMVKVAGHKNLGGLRDVSPRFVSEGLLGWECLLRIQQKLDGDTTSRAAKAAAAAAIARDGPGGLRRKWLGATAIQTLVELKRRGHKENIRMILDRCHIDSDTWKHFSQAATSTS